MSRIRRALHGAASGYLSLSAASIYSLLSVPVALHYLSNRHFLLWALMSSIAGYLSLVDFGMSGSLARLLVDYKDRRNEGTYGSLIKTGWLVLWVQGSLIWVTGYCLAPLFGWVSDIPADLRNEFVELMRWQTTTLAVAFPMRLFSHLLQAHQRMDVVNYTQVGSLFCGFGFQWLFLHQGNGVYSLAWGSLVATLLSATFLCLICVRLNVFPSAGRWGGARWDQFREIFSYGRDLFLTALGGQLIGSSQTIIITRELGPEAGTLWYVGTRVFNLLNQVIVRIYDVSSWALAEMMAREEKDLLRQRYQTVVVLTVSLSGVLAVGYSLSNSLFVPIWTHGKNWWPPLNDVLLGIWMIEIILRVHNGFAGLTKRVGFQRYIYFIEGIVFVVAAMLVTRRWGLPALIACSIICSASFTVPYGMWRTSRYFGVPLREIAFVWQKPLWKILLVFVPLAVVVAWATSHVQVPPLHLALNVMFSVITGGWLFLAYGLPDSFKAEVLRRAPAFTARPLRRVLRLSGAPSL